MKQTSKPAVQRRSRETRDELINALERLLRRRDFLTLTISDLATEAGVSPGAIYRRFEGGLIAVLFALWRATLERRAASPDAQLDIGKARSLRPALRRAAEIAWTQLREDAHVYRAAYLHARIRPDFKRLDGQMMEKAALVGFRALIQAFRREVKRRDLENAAAATAYLYNTAFVERALFPERLPAWARSIGDKAFVAQVSEFAYSYLATADAPA
jgi:AcrR family transcriptional regulator